MPIVTDPPPDDPATAWVANVIPELLSVVGTSDAWAPLLPSATAAAASAATPGRPALRTHLAYFIETLLDLG
jgi:hypothetical protein